VHADRIVITAPGGPEVLKRETYSVGAPAAREVLLRHSAIGLNYIDIQHRTGRYPLPAYPSAIGLEAAGLVEAIGAEVEDLKPGDHVVYSAPPIGAYASHRIMPADRLVRLPAGLSDEIAAAIFTKGLTAHYLLFTTYRLRAGETILVQAAAGGVGLLLCQWAHHIGARVIGTVGSEAKAELARKHGCDEVILYSKEDFVTRVRALTDGIGVPVVYDAVGRDTFEGSLRCLQPRGLLASYGTASGAIPSFDLFRLNSMGSLYVTSPAFVTHTQDRTELLGRARDLFGAIEAGVLKVAVHGRYPLADAVRAHQDLQGRRTSGAQILLP
jgi:NADPH:quinone reductase